MTCTIAQPSFNLDLPRPDWISLPQTLLMLCGGWTPVPESAFRSVQDFPLPICLREMRFLLLALTQGRLPHKGELWHMRSALSVRLADHRTELINKEFSAPLDLWSVNNICFERSELYLRKPPDAFARDWVEGDCLKLANIVVPLVDVENLCRVGRVRGTGGRPLKAGAFKLFAYAAAKTCFDGLPKTREELVVHLMEHPSMPARDRPGETTIHEIVRELFLAHAAYRNDNN
jgi:hypothetical protein